MAKTLFTVIASLSLSLAVYLFIHLGVYKSVTVSVEKRGPFHLLYKTHIGAYHEIGMTIHEVELWAIEHNLPCTDTFGEFLDNPDVIDQDRLRSHVGCILTSPLSSKPEGFEYEERAEHEFVIGKFAGSPSLGPFKAYPKIKKYLEDHRLKSEEVTMEIYHVNGPNVTTEYLFPVANP